MTTTPLHDSSEGLAAETPLSSSNGAGARPRLLDLERAKGLAILLVVFGHLLPYADVPPDHWYAFAKRAVYSFHMPLFMYLSGYVFFLTGAHLRCGAAYRHWIRQRADRLLTPFLALAVVIVLAKYAAGRIVATHDGVDSLWQGVVDTVQNTPNNPALTIWYLLVLFVFSAVTPLLFTRLKLSLGLVFAVSLLLGFVDLTEDFYIDRILHFFQFFVFGGIMVRYGDRLLSRNSVWWISVLLFGLALWFNTEIPFRLTICGFLSIIAIHGLFRRHWWPNEPVLLWFGAASMAIYLMNTLFIGAGKAVVAIVAPLLTGPALGLALAFLMIVGVFGPIAVREALDRTPGLGFVARYLR